MSDLLRLVEADPSTWVSQPMPALHAALLDTSLPAAKLFIETVLGPAATTFMAVTPGVIRNPPGATVTYEGIRKFWSATVADVRALAAGLPASDHHWLTSLFLGDRPEVTDTLTGREFLHAFDSWTNAVISVEGARTRWNADHGITGDGVLNSARVRSWLLPFFESCENGEQSSSTPGATLGLTIRDGRMVVEPIHFYPLGPALPTPAPSRLAPGFTLRGFVLEPVIEQLEQMINARNCREQDLQEFFEQHVELLSALSGHTDARAQVRLSSAQVLIEAGGLRPGRPDFFLRAEDGFWDLLEIKRPSAKIVARTQRGVRLSQAVTDGVQQLRDYRESLLDDRRVEWLHDEHGIATAFPRLYLLIGRDQGFPDARWKRRLVQEIPDVSLATYDDLVRLARTRALMIP